MALRSIPEDPIWRVQREEADQELAAALAAEPIDENLDESNMPKWLKCARKPRPRAKLQWKKQRTLWKVQAEKAGNPKVQEYDRTILPPLPSAPPAPFDHQDVWEAASGHRPLLNGRVKPGSGYGNQAADPTPVYKPALVVGNFTYRPAPTIHQLDQPSRGPWGRPTDPQGMVERLARPKPMLDPVLPAELLAAPEIGPVSAELFERLSKPKVTLDPILPHEMFEKPARAPPSPSLFERLAVPKQRVYDDEYEEEVIGRRTRRITGPPSDDTLRRLAQPKQTPDPFLYLPELAKARPRPVSPTVIERLAEPKHRIVLPPRVKKAA